MRGRSVRNRGRPGWSSWLDCTPAGANISFLRVHLVLPLAGALLLAAVVGSLLTVAAGPARITRLRRGSGGAAG